MISSFARSRDNFVRAAATQSALREETGAIIRSVLRPPEKPSGSGEIYVFTVSEPMRFSSEEINYAIFESAITTAPAPSESTIISPMTVRLMPRASIAPRKSRWESVR